MNRLLAAFLFVVFASSATAFQPRTGTWWNKNESGTAYNFEFQDGTLVITIYSYLTGGTAQWYLSSGAMTNNQHNYVGTLDKYVGGPCISCQFTGPPTRTGNDGTISIVFLSETSATVTLPGGRTTQIQPFNFGIGDPPNGLLGEWIFVYDLGSSTYAQRFDFTALGPASSSGNGTVLDLSRLGVCELQVTGVGAGTVFCGQIDAMGNTLSLYTFSFGLEETYSGNVLSPPNPSGKFYPMKGFKVVSKSGIARHMTVPGAGDATADGSPTPAAILRAANAANAGFQAISEALTNAINRAPSAP
jgi:hypothetical protein